MDADIDRARDVEWLNGLTEQIIAGAMRVHSKLGPGLLESVYEVCLAHELVKRGLSVERQKPLLVKYDDVLLDSGYRMDLLVEGAVILELKAVDALTDLHKAQLLSYLKLADCKVGLLINFNVVHLKSGASPGSSTTSKVP